MSIRRELLSVVLLSTLALCIPSSIVADAVVSAVSPTVGTGVSFDIPVSVSQVSDLYAYEFDLSFDPAILELLSISEGPFLPGAGATFFLPGTIDNTAGTATFTADSLVGPVSGASVANGNGELAVFTFESLSEGTSALKLSNVTLLDSGLNDIAFGTTDGQAIVSGEGVPEPSPLPVLAVILACTIPVARKLRKRAL
jgi:general secretion pathway protein D